MLMEYNPSTEAFFIRVPRGDPMMRVLLQEHGWDMSISGSSSKEAVMLSHEPYAAVHFYDIADTQAQHALIELKKDVDASWATTSEAHIDCPGDQELWGFQKAGVEFALRHKNTLIGDQPGLGKTPQAICVANEMRAKHVLVLCPANIRLQWAKSIRRWSTMDWPYNVQPVLKGSDGVSPYAQWTVVSYDLARTPEIQRALLGVDRYDLLVLDEAHMLKNNTTKRTRSVFGGGEAQILSALSTRAGNILALTGTPLPNRPREAYTLARGLCFDSIDFASEDAFKLKFNPSMRGETEDGRVYIDERTGRHAELQARLRANFMVRREKHGPNGVLEQLHLPDYDIVHVEETGAVKAALKAESMLHIDLDHLPGPDDPVFGQIATARRMMGVAIAPLAAEYVEMCLTGGEEKIVLFGHHIEVLNILQERLKHHGVVRIDGKTSAAGKQRAVDHYINDPRTRVFLANIQTGGVGIDGLQAVCDHMVFAESSWVIGENQQCVDRLDRWGQKMVVSVEFLVAPQSLSERILARALDKGHTIHKVLDARYAL